MMRRFHGAEGSGWWLGLGVALICSPQLGAQDRLPPYLVSATPLAQSVNVATTQVVSFVFSEPMNTAPANRDLRLVAAFPPAGPLPFEPRWSGDQRTLNCQPLPAWPVGTTILWTLGTNFLDTAGNPLASHVVGGFTTAHGTPTGPGTGTNHITEFQLTRWDRYRQTEAGGPVLTTPWAAQFEAITLLASNRTAAAVNLITPALASLPLGRDDNAQERFNLVELSANPIDLAGRYTGGHYRFRVYNDAGLSEALLFFPLAQPPAPAVLDWETTRGMDADEPWTLTWQPWPGAAADDYIQILIGDGLLRTPAAGEPGALPGATTEWIVPAGTLAPRSACDVTILFTTLLSTSDPAKLEIISARRTTATTFEIRTAPLPGERLMLSTPVWLGRQLEVELSGPPDTIILLQANQDWAANGWGLLLATNTGPGWVTLRLPWDPAAPARFFRARPLLE